MILEIKWQVCNTWEKIRMGRSEFALLFLYYLHSLSSPRLSACCTMDNWRSFLSIRAARALR